MLKSFPHCLGKGVKQICLLLTEISIAALQMLFRCYFAIDRPKQCTFLGACAVIARKAFKTWKEGKKRDDNTTSMPEQGFEPGTLRTTVEYLSTAPRGPAGGG